MRFKLASLARALVGSLVSCAPGVPPKLQSMAVLTTGEAGYVSNHRVQRSSFSTKEGIVVAVQVTWDATIADAGAHDVDWRLFRDTQLLKEKRSTESLDSKPVWIVSHISKESLPPGRYGVRLFVDNAPLAETRIDIVPVPQAKYTAPFKVGPDCAGVPHNSIKVIRTSFPAFPPSAMDNSAGGCAVLSILIGADGYPADVEVLAEQPKGLGFGDAAATAAWNYVFPSGHAGETVFQRTGFRVVPAGTAQLRHP